RVDGTRLRHRRGPRPPRREPRAAAGVRAPARADRAGADADRQPAPGGPAVRLVSVTRPAAGEPAGLLVLVHGRGSNEHDLRPVLDLVDPDRRLLGVTPRGPLTF